MRYQAALHPVGRRNWQGQKDLNPRHVVLETTALPTELYPYEMAEKMGFEPMHQLPGLTV